MAYVAPRFWLPEGEEIQVFDQGYMPDPRERWWGTYMPEFLSLEELGSVPCLILIGEPGLGKTLALRCEFERIRDVISGTEDHAHWVNLGSTRDESRLEDKIFAAAPFRDWADGDGRLWLFLDALDEARLRITRVAELILAGLEGQSVDRLVLRLSCRSADRHPGLEAELRNRFSPERFEVRELAPLLRRDVCDIANDHGVDGDHFVTETIERELQPLAMIPDSLNLLLGAVDQTGNLPPTRVEAFEQGLTAQAGEPDRDRDDIPRLLDASGRMAIAARIAAATLLSGRTAIRSAGGTASSDEALVADLAGGREEDRTLAVPAAVDAGPAAVTETLGTGLFAVQGSSRAFRQASYAEYLCARWLAGGALTADQLDDLVFMDTGAEQPRVVPQLREVATWLAEQDRGFLERLLERDPTVLLRADPVGLGPDGHERLIEALLAGAAAQEIDRFDRRRRTIYPRLKYPGLAARLRAVIGDRASPSLAREVACDVAGACLLKGLSKDLVAITLDSGDELRVRAAAIDALAQFAGRTTLARLRPLAIQPVAEDTEDELKGAALSAVWPKAMRADEVFAALTPEKRGNLYGQYKSFVRTDLLQHLGDRDLPTALRWAAHLPVEHFPTDVLSDVRERLLIRAWPLLRDRGVLTEAYVSVITGLLEDNAALLSHLARDEHQDVFEDDGGRRILVKRLIDSAGDGGVEAADLLYSTPPLLRAHDVDWAVKQLRSAVESASEVNWAGLIESLVAVTDVGDESAVMEARSVSPHLRRVMAHRYEAVELGSLAADEMRASFERWARLTRDDVERPPPLDVAKRVTEALDRVDDGDLDGFWLALKWLEIDQDAHHRQYFISRVSQLPAWEAISERDRARLRTAAPRYLAAGPPDPKLWFARNKIYWPATAGYRALRLIAEEPDLQAINALDDEIWRQWAPVIVDWHRNGGGDSDEAAFNDWAIEHLVSIAPDAAAMWLGRRLDADLRGGGHPFVLHRFERVWSSEIEQALLVRAQRSRLEPGQRTEVLAALVRNGSADGIAHARRLVSSAALKAGQHRRELAVRVTALLATESVDCDWNQIWSLVLADDQFGRDLIQRLAVEENRHVASRLTERQAADLFLWLAQRFPYAKDPVDHGAHVVTGREQVGHWRDQVLSSLRTRATRASVQELGRLIAECPELPWLRRVRREAENALQRAEWTPPPPRLIIQLADQTAARYVRSAPDLRRVVLAALGRIQQLLRGVRAQAIHLWDTGGRRPKPERTVAFWIEEELKRDLAERGIVIGREVELNPHPKGQMGEAVDLLITAVAGKEIEGAEQVSVSVEVKCCWNRALDSDMSDQLVDRYLDEELTQGIYLVVQFDSPNWDDSDKANRRRCRRRTVDEARAFFDEQAKQVSEAELADVSAFVLDCQLT